MIIFLDDQFIEASTAFIESLSPGKVKGKGVFETMRVEQGKVILLKEHLKRMRKGLQKLKIKTSFNGLEGQIVELLRRNHLKNARVRLMVWKDKKGLHRNIIASAYKAPSFKDYQRGFSIMVSTYKRNPTALSAIKSIDYSVFRRAFHEAKAKNVNEAILLNSHGHVVEGSRTNTFIVRNGQLLTPALESGALEGITRQIVLNAGRKMGLKVLEQPLRLLDLLCAEEVFLTNSLLGLMPVAEINEISVGHGPRRFWLKLSREYKQIEEKSI